MVKRLVLFEALALLEETRKALASIDEDEKSLGISAALTIGYEEEQRSGSREWSPRGGPLNVKDVREVLEAMLNELDQAPDRQADAVELARNVLNVAIHTMKKSLSVPTFDSMTDLAVDYFRQDHGREPSM